MKLAVVVPARNEAPNIGRTLDQITARLSHERVPYEVVVVDDGSTDATTGEVRVRSRVDPAVRLVQNGPPHGFGRAVRRGLEMFDADAVAIMMGDGSDDVEDLVRYSAPMSSGDARLCCPHISI